MCSVVALSAGCAGPRSTGALWAQQNVEREAALFRLSDAQRVEQAHMFELGLADEEIATERARLGIELQACPGPVQAFAPSANNAVRDGIRIRAQGDATRLTAVAQVALADWRIRRAHSTGQTRFCDDARAALAGATSFGEPSSSELLTRLPRATVTRDPRRATAAPDAAAPAETLSNYALGYVDAVTAAAPLPQYLGLVYGGFVYPSGPAPAPDDESAAQTVDREAAAYPQWEPDALYAALRAARG